MFTLQDKNGGPAAVKPAAPPDMRDTVSDSQIGIGRKNTKRYIVGGAIILVLAGVAYKTTQGSPAADVPEFSALHKQPSRSATSPVSVATAPANGSAAISQPEPMPQAAGSPIAASTPGQYPVVQPAITVAPVPTVQTVALPPNGVPTAAAPQPQVQSVTAVPQNISSPAMPVSQPIQAALPVIAKPSVMPIANNGGQKKHYPYGKRKPTVVNQPVMESDSAEASEVVEEEIVVLKN